MNEINHDAGGTSRSPQRVASNTSGEDEGAMGRKKPSNEAPAGSVELPEGGDFMRETAEDDRATTKAKHVDDGLKAVAEMVDRMKRGLAYAAMVHDFDVKLTVLSEIADTAAAVRDDARSALRNAQIEKRNGQPGPKKD